MTKQAMHVINLINGNIEHTIRRYILRSNKHYIYELTEFIVKITTIINYISVIFNATGIIP